MVGLGLSLPVEDGSIDDLPLALSQPLERLIMGLGGCLRLGRAEIGRGLNQLHKVQRRLHVFELNPKIVGLFSLSFLSNGRRKQFEHFQQLFILEAAL